MPPSAPLLQFVRANLRLTYSALILRSGWTAEPNTRTIYDVVLLRVRSVFWLKFSSERSSNPTLRSTNRQQKKKLRSQKCLFGLA